MQLVEIHNSIVFEIWLKLLLNALTNINDQLKCNLFKNNTFLYKNCF